MGLSGSGRAGPGATLYVAPAPPWLFPAASCSGALCRSDILLIRCCSSSSGRQHRQTKEPPSDTTT